jgi:prepilin-type N-terminal cleavage/methylation domain-containing protein
LDKYGKINIVGDIMKNRGFTLIELLAVIIILSIIALISTPAIIGLIDNARKESFKNTTLGIVKAGELLYYQDLLNGTNEEVTFSYTNGVETSNIDGKSLNYSGTKPDSGTVIVNSEGKVLLVIYKGNYCAVKGLNDSEAILLQKSREECAFADNTGAPIPEISDGMIPIKWDVINNKWVKADVNNVIGPNQWYNYEVQEWANVVLVKESSRSDYKTAIAGTEILETDVLAYLVWVPRYKYKLFNVNSNSIPAETIEIVFESKTTNKSTGKTGDTYENGNYITHPAFTFGTDELNGIWVGKFETTGDATTPTVKPNLPSLRDQNIKTQFETAQKFNDSIIYGITSEFDSHMMKNTEWGAVAYLSQSNYGKFGNSIYTGLEGLEKEIWTNPSVDYVTGRGGNLLSKSSTLDDLGVASSTLYSYDGRQCNIKVGYECTGPLQSVYGMASSTTGNVYGIYDMSGGSYEYVMGAMYELGDKNIMLWDSGFNQDTIDSDNMSKYINKYTYGENYDDQDAFNRKLLGDATGETCGWYGDYTDFVNDYGPWFIRGGGYDDGPSAGVYLFYSSWGDAGVSSFRLVGLKS